MSLPIGVFDSGLGGLTVLKALMGKFPDQEFIYLGDTARLPYGNKSPATLRRFVQQNMRWMEHRGVGAVIVACNSASTALVTPNPFPFPVFDVIEPGAAAGVVATKTGSIAVIATRATVNSNAYLRAIHKIEPSADVTQIACPLLVPLVEEGWLDDDVTRSVLRRYLEPVFQGAQTQVDTLILGCTHFPVLKSLIQDIVGKGISIVESGPAIATRLEPLLKFNSAAPKREAKIFVTDLSPQFRLLTETILEAPEKIAIEVTSIQEEGY